jgi:PPK2 family polyphosphate:nucleotide phosphotransferase
MPKINLNEISTKAPKHLEKEQVKEETERYLKQLEDLQEVLAAQAKYALLVVIQGQDASGKDGAIKNIFRALNPQGVAVKSFKKPSAEELSHDYLWRVHEAAPAKGQIKIFNRSHYEDVLIVRVEGWIDEKTAHKRFEHINAFEKLLTDNNTIILKFFLHVSPEEQQERFYERMTDPKKQWKYSEEDFQKLKKREQYQPCYEDIFEHCSPDNAPWTIVPADQNWYKEYIIAKTVCNALEKLNMQYPSIKLNMDNPDVKELLDKFKDSKHD